MLARKKLTDAELDMWIKTKRTVDLRDESARIVEQHPLHPIVQQQHRVVIRAWFVAKEALIAHYEIWLSQNRKRWYDKFLFIQREKHMDFEPWMYSQIARATKQRADEIIWDVA